MIFTTLQNKIKRNGIWVNRAVSLIFWIIIWYIAALLIDNALLLPTPLSVISRFFTLIVTDTFVISVANTVLRILAGYFSALLSSVILSVITGIIPLLRTLITPFMAALKSIPVASFVILALLWFDTERLSTFIAFVMVLPVMYISLVSGIDSCDEKNREMAKVFRISPFKKALYVYLPDIIPFFKSGCNVSLGLCWKAGIAAELIGVPSKTIGEQLYFSKIYFEMTDLFAWTITIILISMLFEKVFIFLLNKIVAIYERM